MIIAQTDHIQPRIACDRYPGDLEQVIARMLFFYNCNGSVGPMEATEVDDPIVYFCFTYTPCKGVDKSTQEPPLNNVPSSSGKSSLSKR